MNPSQDEHFESAYRRVWFALHRGDDPDLSQHERDLLQHVPATGGIALGDLARHLGLPMSTASVLVKSLAGRGFLVRQRASDDERRLSIRLSAQGQARVSRDTVLDPIRLRRALRALSPRDREQLLQTLGALADAAERIEPQR
jgi:MarR family transcriptional regulator, organic hydroperoxide resistance regulator